MPDLSYVRGTTFRMTFNYTPAEGEAEGAKALFTVKAAIDNDATDSDSENNILVPKNVDMTDNSCIITIEPGDVSVEHDKGNNYIWDIKVLDENDNIFPAVSGNFQLDVTATNRITV